MHLRILQFEQSEGELREKMKRHVNAPPQVIQKIVEVPVERIVEKRVEIPVSASQYVARSSYYVQESPRYMFETPRYYEQRSLVEREINDVQRK